jgi:cation:H+ antiporter
LIVLGASGIGESLGMSSFLIGATLVAFGTSAPELATALIARVRGHDEVGVGTILGSNVFNCLFVVGMTGLVGPFELQGRAVLPSILLGMTALLLIIPISGNQLHRTRGYGLLGVYMLSILAAWMAGRG